MMTKNLNGTRRRGFTLVELLTVVAIIVLLIGILVPAVNAVRRNARNTATKATIGSIETAIAAFRADQRVGGNFPPSAPDGNGQNGALPYYVAANPYTQQGVVGDGGSDRLRLTGAGLLVWALAGADLLGTPGFKPVRSSSSTWSQDTDDKTSPSDGAYALDNNGNPRFGRSGPYVDLSKVRVSTFNKARKSFDIEAEVEAREQAGKPDVVRKYPMFLDSFGFPLLYWKADPAGVRAADNPVGAKVEFGNDRGVYHYRENAPLLGYESGPQLGSGDQTLILRPTAQQDSPHKLDYEAPPANLTPTTPVEGFWAYIRNKDVPSKIATQNADSYMLVSAGEDGVFGTGDDIANFNHNGAEVEREN